MKFEVPNAPSPCQGQLPLRQFHPLSRQHIGRMQLSLMEFRIILRKLMINITTIGLAGLAFEGKLNCSYDCLRVTARLD